MWVKYWEATPRKTNKRGSTKAQQIQNQAANADADVLRMLAWHPDACGLIQMRATARVTTKSIRNKWKCSDSSHILPTGSHIVDSI